MAQEESDSELLVLLAEASLEAKLSIANYLRAAWLTVVYISSAMFFWYLGSGLYTYKALNCGDGYAFNCLIASSLTAQLDDYWIVVFALAFVLIVIAATHISVSVRAATRFRQKATFVSESDTEPQL